MARIFVPGICEFGHLTCVEANFWGAVIRFDDSEVHQEEIIRDLASAVSLNRVCAISAVPKGYRARPRPTWEMPSGTVEGWAGNVCGRHGYRHEM